MPTKPEPKHKDSLARWRRSPVAFIEEVLRDPENGRPFKVYDQEREFLSRAFKLTSDGRLEFPELVFSAGKKSGKTALAAWCAIYAAVVLGGPFAEVYCLANDYEQAASRVFQAAARIVEASPLLKGSAKVTSSRIDFSTGASIVAVANDYAGFAGANPTLTVYDELWAFVHTASVRLFDESVPSPARKISGRLTVTYAGFSGESTLLESLYKRGISGVEVAPSLFESEQMLCYWASGDAACRAPWQTQKWLDQMRKQLPPNQYARMILNQWVSAESAFISAEQYDACVVPGLHPVLSEPGLPVYVGVDASVRHDTTAVVVCTYDQTKRVVRVVAHKCLKPVAGDIDFSALEGAIRGLRERFSLQSIYFDPYQLIAVAQRLTSIGLPMVEFPQTPANLSLAGSTLYELIVSRNFVTYASDELRAAVLNCAVIESARGFRLAKERPSAHIDLAAALSFAALGAARNGPKSEPGIISFYRDRLFGPPTKTVADNRAIQALTGFRVRLKTELCFQCGVSLLNKSSVTGSAPNSGELIRTCLDCHKLPPGGKPAEGKPEKDTFGRPVRPGGKPDIFELMGACVK